MAKEKKKMDTAKKMKLIYSGELLIFAVIFLVLGMLKLFGVIKISERYKQRIFPIITLIGGAWFIIDFIWACVSKKHREKSALIDKFLVMPASLCTVAFDIYAFVIGPLNVNADFYQYYSSSLFLYFALIYVFQAIYHYYHPIKYLMDGIDKIEQAEAEEAKENAIDAETTEHEESAPQIENNSEPEGETKSLEEIGKSE